jgi:uncharacterized membrane protein
LSGLSNCFKKKKKKCLLTVFLDNVWLLSTLKKNTNSLVFFVCYFYFESIKINSKIILKENLFYISLIKFIFIFYISIFFLIILTTLKMQKGIYNLFGNAIEIMFSKNLNFFCLKLFFFVFSNCFDVLM